MQSNRLKYTRNASWHFLQPTLAKQEECHCESERRTSVAPELPCPPSLPRALGSGKAHAICCLLSAVCQGEKYKRRPVPLFLGLVSLARSFYLFNRSIVFSVSFSFSFSIFITTSFLLPPSTFDLSSSFPLSKSTLYAMASASSLPANELQPQNPFDPQRSFAAGYNRPSSFHSMGMLLGKYTLPILKSPMYILNILIRQLTIPTSSP